MSRKLWRATRAVALLTLTALMVSATSVMRSAQAAVLEQKWVAGQQLSYDVMVDGTLNMMTDPAAPFPLAGLPLEIKVSGAGEVALDTRAVADDGMGLIAILVPRLQLKGEAWGQKAVFDIKDGQANFSINGQKADGGKGGGMDARALIEPPVALQISRLGRLQGIVPLPPKADGASAQPNDKAAKAGERGPLPNLGGLLPAALLQALPQLWPGRDIKTGEKWTVEPQIPIPAQAQKTDAETGDAGAGFTMLSLGKIDMTLLGEERIEGRQLQRIGVRGALGLDKDKAAMLAGAGNRAGDERGGSRKLTNARQLVDGDIWFDAAMGQVVRVTLKLHGQFAQSGVTPPKDPAKAKAKAWNATQDFDGTLQMQLRKVSHPGQSPAATAAGTAGG